MSKCNPFLPNQHFIYPLKHQNGEIYAWKVDIQRSGKVHIQVFEISEYGGEEAALLAAERVRISGC